MAPADQEQLGSDLSAYVDGELSPQRARQVERLLEESEDARRLLARLRSVSQDLGDLPRVPAPETLAETIRRARERRTPPPQRGPARGWRVLRLATRIVASAAVIVICMFTGWMMHDRLAPSAPTGRDRVARRTPAPEQQFAKSDARGRVSGKLAPADMADAESPVVALRALESLGYVGADVDTEAESVPLAEAPFVGEEVLIAARPPLSEIDESTIALGAPIVAGDVHTDVSVVVAPGGLDQFNRTLQVVSVWQGQATALAKDSAAEFSRKDDNGDGVLPAPRADKRRAGELSGPTQRDFIVQVPPGRVAELLQSLEHQAPRQVQVVMRFKPEDLSRVQQMVMPYDALAPKDELQVAKSEPPTEESAPAFARARGTTAFEKRAPESTPSGRGGGRGRGRIARRAAQPEASLAAREKAGERGRPVAAGISRKGPGEEPAESSLSVDHARDQDMAKKSRPSAAPAKEARGELGVTMLDARCPRVADVARPISEAIRQQASALPAGAFALDQARELGDHLGDASATMLDTVRRSALGTRAEPASADRGAVTLRVTVLPPPQTTQPASATSSPAP